MAYGDLSLDAPLKPNKGLEGGACNRQSCQAEPALYYNHGSGAWYCVDCKRDIGEDWVNKRSWELTQRLTLGHAMFETREEIDARKAKAAQRQEQRVPDIDRYLPWARPAAPRKSSSLERLLKQAKRR